MKEIHLKLLPCFFLFNFFSHPQVFLEVPQPVLCALAKRRWTVKLVIWALACMMHTVLSWSKAVGLPLWRHAVFKISLLHKKHLFHSSCETSHFLWFNEHLTTKHEPTSIPFAFFNEICAKRSTGKLHQQNTIVKLHNFWKQWVWQLTRPNWNPVFVSKSVMKKVRPKPTPAPCSWPRLREDCQDMAPRSNTSRPHSFDPPERQLGNHNHSEPTKTGLTQLSNNFGENKNQGWNSRFFDFVIYTTPNTSALCGEKLRWQAWRPSWFSLSNPCAVISKKCTWPRLVPANSRRPVMVIPRNKNTLLWRALTFQESFLNMFVTKIW